MNDDELNEIYLRTIHDHPVPARPDLMKLISDVKTLRQDLDSAKKSVSIWRDSHWESSRAIRNFFMALMRTRTHLNHENRLSPDFGTLVVNLIEVDVEYSYNTMVIRPKERTDEEDDA